MKHDNDDIYITILIITIVLILFNFVMFAHVFKAIEELKQLL